MLSLSTQAKSQESSWSLTKWYVIVGKNSVSLVQKSSTWLIKFQTELKINKCGPKLSEWWPAQVWRKGYLYLYRYIDKESERERGSESESVRVKVKRMMVSQSLALYRTDDHLMLQLIIPVWLSSWRYQWSLFRKIKKDSQFVSSLPSKQFLVLSHRLSLG